MPKNWAEQEAVKLRGKICCCNDPQSDEVIAQALRKVADDKDAEWDAASNKMIDVSFDDGYGKGFAKGFEAAREAAAKVAEGHAKQQEKARNINQEAMALIIEEDIRALTPEGKR